MNAKLTMNDLVTVVSERVASGPGYSIPSRPAHIVTRPETAPTYLDKGQRDQYERRLDAFRSGR